MQVERYDSAGNRVQSLKVPIAYAPKEKMLVRASADIDQAVAVQLPRMGFEITSFAYDAQRKLNNLNKWVNVTTDDEETLKVQYQGVPYDLTFSLYIMVKNAYDGVQIVEQILPFFTPDWTATLNIIPEMNIKADTPVVFQSMVTEDVYEGDFDSRRALIYTLDFVMKANMYGPVKTSGIINKAIVDMFVPHTDAANTQIQDSEIGTTAPSQRVTTTPGLTTGGLPTSNSQNSVAFSTISADDPFGFVQSHRFFGDGTINPSTSGNLFAPIFGPEFK